MTWEAAFWVGLALAARASTKATLVWLESRGFRWVDLLSEFAPWLHGLLIAYLALVSGAILGRHAGLYGHTLRGWAAGAALTVALLAIAYLLPRWRTLPLSLPPPLETALDEPRWALYRAAGHLWTGVFLGGLAIGLGLAVVEWILNWRPWRSAPELGPRAWGDLLRTATSTLVFGVSGNLWLTLIAQLSLAVMARRARR